MSSRCSAALARVAAKDAEAADACESSRGAPRKSRNSRGALMLLDDDGDDDACGSIRSGARPGATPRIPDNLSRSASNSLRRSPKTVTALAPAATRIAEREWRLPPLASDVPIDVIGL